MNLFSKTVNPKNSYWSFLFFSPCLKAQCTRLFNSIYFHENYTIECSFTYGLCEISQMLIRLINEILPVYWVEWTQLVKLLCVHSSGIFVILLSPRPTTVKLNTEEFTIAELVAAKQMFRKNLYGVAQRTKRSFVRLC